MFVYICIYTHHVLFYYKARIYAWLFLNHWCRSPLPPIFATSEHYKTLNAPPGVFPKLISVIILQSRFSNLSSFISLVLDSRGGVTHLLTHTHMDIMHTHTCTQVSGNSGYLSHICLAGVFSPFAASCAHVNLMTPCEAGKKIYLSSYRYNNIVIDALFSIL